ncbi:monocarboxylate transporter 13 isoform X2 [Halyomorpha halys]|uniref:monocarboxylate transporter 13 isoform X2 n=1 Tax=Halyomorpha halys TaxID=286706 RepID=UPI0006D4EB17|nr:monocarboxylate transporter 13 isoform X2 [Halyomorpha halys]
MSHGGVEVKGITPPDGGWGWVVVFASFMIHIFADGVTYSFGVFHNELVLYFKETEAATSLIASILVGVTLCTGPISSALVNRYGCRPVTVAGAIVGAAGLTLSAFAQNVQTLYITIGLLTGTGLGLIYLPAIVSVTCYFDRYRSLATGIAVCGSGMGTFLMAPLTEWLVTELTWRGAIALTGALMLHCIIFGLLFRPLEPEPEDDSPESVAIQPINGNVQVVAKRPHSIHGGLGSTRLATSQPALTSEHRRFGSVGVMYRKDIFYSGSLAHLPQDKRSTTWLEVKPGEEKPLMGGSPDQESDKTLCGLSPETSSILMEMLDFSLFKDPIFLIFSLSNFCTSLGFNVPYVYIVSQAEERGLTKRDGSYLLAIIGVANTVGRIVLGYFSDKDWVNRLWIYNLCLTACGITTALSCFSTNMAGFILYASLFGFTIGAYVGLTSVILVDLLGLDKLTNAFGLLLLFQGIASFLGPPITGWLYDATKSYTVGFIFAGAMMSLSGIMLFAVPTIQRCIARRSSSSLKNGTVIKS